MDFSYKNNPILYKIAKRSLGDDLTYLENRKQWGYDFKMNVVHELWTEFAPSFRQIYYLENIFAEAIRTRALFLEDKYSPRSLRSLQRAAPCQGATLLFGRHIFCLYADPGSRTYCLFVFDQSKFNRSLVLTTGFHTSPRKGPAVSLHIHTMAGYTLFRPVEANNYCYQMCANFDFLKNLPDRHKTELPAFGKIEHPSGQVFQNGTNMSITLCGVMSPSKIIPLQGVADLH